MRSVSSVIHELSSKGWLLVIEAMAPTPPATMPLFQLAVLVQLVVVLVVLIHLPSTACVGGALALRMVRAATRVMNRE